LRIGGEHGFTETGHCGKILIEKNNSKTIYMRELKTMSFCIIIALLSAHVYSQTDSLRLEKMTREEILSLSQDELLEMSMEDLVFLAQMMGISIDELLNMKTSVASKITLTPRETPGIVSIITEEEIRYSGARDLIDVLRLVPGFDFGYDVQGVIGVGLRGNWVHEGKILMLIDGQQMNELSYSNIPFGNHIPVDQIKRVEIIRGPGSAIYGGNAELGVINIITKSGKDIHGAEAIAIYGQMIKSMGRANLDINSGITVKNWDISAKGFMGEANRSDQLYTEYIDNLENTIDLSKGGSEIKTRQLNLGANNENLSFRFIYDDYKTRYLTYSDSIIGNVGVYNQFKNMLGEVKYNLNINEKLSITPKLNYKYSRPYFEEDYWRNFEINRYTGTVLLNYLLNNKTSLVSGIEWFMDRGHMIEDTGIFYSNNARSIIINNISAFAEGVHKMKKINLIAGFRTELNSDYGWAFAPRIGATGIFNKFHFKTLFSGAFRSPGIGNIDVALAIEPEKSFVTEMELGYRINEYMFVTANVFDIYIKNSIIYFDFGGWTPGVDWGYFNADNSGSDGFEIEFKSRYSKGYATINYSFYTQAFRAVPESYSVPVHENSALGLSQHKIGLNCNYKPVNNLSISPSLSLFSKKYGFNALDESENPLISDFDPYCLFNVSITCENLIRRGFNITLAAFDLFNQKPPYIQPYNGGYFPYPGSSREILLKIVLSTELLKGR
jgi:outer membrane receptor for ferrienterochelin and colicin